MTNRTDEGRDPACAQGALPNPLDEVEHRIRAMLNAAHPYPATDADAQAQISYCAGLQAALDAIEEVREQFRRIAAEHVPGRVY
jgi:hypothetical protein